MFETNFWQNLENAICTEKKIIDIKVGIITVMVSL